MQVVIRHDDGTETDVTEAVQVLYDQVHASMDWGSGFLSTEDYGLVFAFADVAGFEPPIEPYGLYPAHDRKIASIKEKAAEIRALFKKVPVVQ